MSEKLTQQCVRRVVWTFYVLRAITAFGYASVLAVYTQFLYSKGLSSFEVHSVAMVFYATQLLCEVPTSAFADYYGKKKAFVLSCLLMVVAKILYAFAPTLWWCVAAEVLSGIGIAFSNGALQSWVVNQLKTLVSPTERYHIKQRIFSVENTLRGGVMAFSAAVCAWGAEYSLTIPWVVSAVCLFIAMIASLRYLTDEDPTVTISAVFRQRHESLLSILREGMHIVRWNDMLLFLIGLGVVQSFAQQAPQMNWQPYLKTLVGKERYLGYCFVGLIVAQMAGSWLAHMVSRRVVHPHRALALIHVLFGCGVMFAAIWQHLVLALSFMALYSAARGLFMPLRDFFVHQYIHDDEKRATLASFETLARHAGAVFGLLATGYLIERLSLRTTWVSMGALIVITGCVQLVRYARTVCLQPDSV